MPTINELVHRNRPRSQNAALVAQDAGELAQPGVPALPEGVTPEMWAHIQRHPLSQEALNYNMLKNLSSQTGFDTAAWRGVLDHFTKSQAEGRTYLEGAGATAKADAKRTSLSRSGELDQSLMDSGFYDSSLRHSLQQREKESLARTHGAIDEGVRGQRLAYDQQWAATIGGTMANRPNPYAPLADVYRMALLTRMTPAGSSPNYSGIGAGIGGGLGAGIGAIVGGGAGAVPGYMIGSGVGGAAGSFVR